jgi:hypothetical protein
VQENNSNVFLSLAPYYGFGNKSFTLQAGLGLKYLMQKAASTKADYTAKPTTIMLDYSVPQAKTSLFLIEPNLRTVFGKRGNPLRFYLEAGYIMPSGKTEFNYTTRGDLTTLIDSKTGLLNTKYLDASKAVTQTGNFMKGFMTVGAGILWNLSPDKKLTENAQMPTVNNYGVNDDGIKRTVPKDDKPQKYIAPQALSPANGTMITESDSKKPLEFKWAPVTPKPLEAVTYKLRIFEIKQGQIATTVVKNTKPLFEKEVINQIRFVLPALSQLTISKGSSYGWNVQAVGPLGNSIGENNGMSETNTIAPPKIIETKIDSIKVKCCENGKHQIYLKVKNMLSTSVKTTTIGYRENGTGSLVDITSLISPTLPRIINGNNTQIYTANIDCINGLSSLKLVVYSEGTNTADKEIIEATDTLNCQCKACDLNINIPNSGTITIDSTLWLVAPVTVTPKTVKSIKAQLVSFEYKPESDDCVSCNRESGKWGNFIGGTLNDNKFPLNGTLTHGHELQWNSTNANVPNVSGNFNFHISLPPLVKCCTVDIKFCIRYIFELTDCAVCETVVCYSYSKTTK